MNSRDRLLNAFTDSSPDRPPVWIMRQAGRYLPEYRALKEQHDFLTLVRTPDLATEVTLQPLRRFPQLDAAIIFSDILIVPEAMGIAYRFRETGGIEMEKRITCAHDVEQLQPETIREQTAYLPAALSQTRRAIGDRKALLGFAGSPWTLATYLIEGGSTRDFLRTQAFLTEQPKAFHALMEKLTNGVADLLLSEIEAGVDAVQLFDSWAAAAPPDRYWECSLRWIEAIIARLPKAFPVILFAKGKASEAPSLTRTGATALAIDHSVSLAGVRATLPAHITLQGNLDPDLMTGPPENAVRAVTALLQSMAPWPRYIFNLGHGITPDARIETVQAVLETIDSARSWG